MKGPYIYRFFKIIQNLIINPDLIIPYINYNLFNQKSPVELSIPWWSFKAIQCADKLLIDKIIYEYGCGGSTLHYAKIAKFIFCVEDNLQWKQIVENKLENENLHNVQIKYAPFDFDHLVNFENSQYLHAFEMRQHFDVVVMDGQDKTF